jgi:hypothetical protein
MSDIVPMSLLNLKVIAPLKWRLYANIQSSGSLSHL